MKKLVVLLFTVMFSLVSFSAWDQAYFRGTANGWAAEAMNYDSATGLWKIQKSFNNGDGGGGPRFKIDHYGDWTENYPSEDVTVEANKTYDITFDDSTKEVTVVVVGEEEETDSWYYRGTSNSWAAEAMTYNESTGLYETEQTFGTDDSRFKIDHYGDWTENYPSEDYTVTGGKTYSITFNAVSKVVNAIEKVESGVYIRTSATNWEAVALENTGGDIYELTLTGPVTFIIDFGGDNTDLYPEEGDLELGEGWKITVNNSTKEVTVVEVIVTPPAAPTNMAVSGITTNSILVSWNAVTDADSYELYQASSANDTYNLLTTTTARSYTVNSLIAETTYYFKAKAVNENGSSDMSNYVSGTTDQEPADTWYFRGTPNSWGTDLMTYNSSTGLYETTQTFVDGDGGGGPRFKISHDTNWGENYPDGDVTVSANKTYKITFNANTKEIETSEAGQAPTVSASLATGTYTEDSLSVSLSASGEGITEAKYKIDNGSWQDFSGSENISIDMSALVDGETKTITVSATNAEGTTEASYTYTRKIAGAGLEIYFENTNNWSNVYIYAYMDDADTVLYTGEWPGETMNEIGDDWYFVTLEGLDSAKIIFTDNAGSQIPNGAGTLRDKKSWYDGQWNDTDPRIDTEAPVVKTNPIAGIFEESTLSIGLVTEDNQDANPVTYYTIDGSTPVIGQSTVYASALIATDSGSGVDLTVKAISKDQDNNISEVFTFEFRLNEDATAPTVTGNPEAGSYEEGTTLNVTMNIRDNKDNNPSLYYTIDNTDPQKTASYLYGGQSIFINSSTTIRYIALDNNGNEKIGSLRYSIGNQRTDFREEAIYFLMTARFYDGDSSNNRYTRAGLNAGADKIGDPAWRGDFKGLIEKLDYIKAMGFSAVWITPPVLNRSDCDYHGYHAYDMSKIDARLESNNAKYQNLIDEVHARGMKVVQDVVINHSGKYGEKNLGGRILWGDSEDPEWGVGMVADYYDVENSDFEYNGLDYEPNSGKNYYTGGTYQSEKPTEAQLPWLYDGDDSYMDPYLWIKGPNDLQPNLDTWGQVFGKTEKEQWNWYAFQWSEHAYTLLNPEIYHLINLGNWEEYDCQQGTMHPDCVDLNTESETVQNYLIETYNRYIDMGVDAFRIDTAKHISRTMFNRHFVPAWKERGGEDFYMFGEVLVKSYDLYPNGAIPLGAPFYTWKEGAIDQNNGTGDQLSPVDWIAAKEGYDTEQNKGYDAQPHSNNHYMDGNNYHTPDYSQKSGLDVIDMQAHANFANANDVWNIRGNDSFYNDATWNVIYVDSHDYGPSTSGNRFAGSNEQWAENFNLMFTWRGIPCVYYGSEIRFKAGAPTDGDPNELLLENSGRAYYGDKIEGTIDVSEFGEWSNATGELANTMDKPLVKHLASLNKMRRAIPALQKGQYSTENVSGGMAFKKRYTNAEENVDSFVLVAISSSATFSGLPGGRYVDAVTGNEVNVSEGGSLTASVSGQGKMRVYVLDLPNGPAPGKIAGNGDLLN